MSTLSFGSHSVITGGTFTQVNNNFQERPQTAWDRLQSAVAPAAFHNSAKRFDPPRCHPSTRVAVMKKLHDLTLQRGDAGKARILWLSGPAGAGKSAIAQSFCEECFSSNLLLASFFFNRSDPSRNTAKFFVGTLAYQIYGKVPAYHQSLILSTIESDPLVFQRSIDAQFKALIMDPLRDLFGTGFFDIGSPTLIVVDGLDECSKAPMQVSILGALESMAKQPDFPFIFLIASRPEHDIQMFFTSSGLGSLLHRVNLDNSFSPHVDIELFLRERTQEICATHPLRHTIPHGWPSSEAIEDLVQKSSGHFIYASVVITYIASSRHYPPNRLDVVRQLRPLKRDVPFSELDALYSHIFSCVEDTTLVLQILRVVILFQEAYLDISTEEVERLCDLDQGDCLSALLDLQSVLQVEPAPQQSIRLLHKSLPDYLQDPRRSHKYHIDTSPTVVIPIVTQCLRLISGPKFDYNLRYVHFVLHHLDLLVSNIRLCHEHLISFSLIDCWKPFRGTEFDTDESWFRNKLLWFAFEYLDKLCTLERTNYKHIYHYHLQQFPKLAEKFLQVYGRGFPAQNRDCVFPMIIIFILSGDSDIQISSKVFDLLQQLPFKLSEIPLDKSPMALLENLPHAAARRCINSLMHDTSPKSVALALEFLPLILPESRLSPDLNEACLSGRPFAYAATGGHELLGLARSARKAMQEYSERYTEAQLSEWE